MVCPVGFGQSWQKSLRMTRLLSKMEGELSVELKLEQKGTDRKTERGLSTNLYKPQGNIEREQVEKRKQS